MLSIGRGCSGGVDRGGDPPRVMMELFFLDITIT